MGVIFKVTRNVDPQLSFGLTGVLGCFLTFVLLLMIREPPKEPKILKQTIPLLVTTQSFSVGQSFVFPELSEVS